jgi:hypothetical protein
MVTFETLASRETTFGSNNFVEIALKRAVDASKPDDPGVTFVSVSRGYVDTAGRRRFRAHFTCPPEPALLDFIASAFGELRDAQPWLPKAVA